MENNKEINEIYSIREALIKQIKKHDLTINQELSIVIETYFLLAKKWLFLLELNGAPDEMLNNFPQKCREIVLEEYDNFLNQITDEGKLGDFARIELFLLP